MSEPKPMDPERLDSPRRWKRWTEEETLDLQRKVSLGWSYHEVAEHLGRTVDSVRVRIHKLRKANRRRCRAQKARRDHAHCSAPLGHRDSCDPLRTWAVTSSYGIGGHHVW